MAPCDHTAEWDWEDIGNDNLSVVSLDSEYSKPEARSAPTSPKLELSIPCVALPTPLSTIRSPEPLDAPAVSDSPRPSPQGAVVRGIKVGAKPVKLSRAVGSNVQTQAADQRARTSQPSPWLGVRPKDHDDTPDVLSRGSNRNRAGDYTVHDCTVRDAHNPEEDTGWGDMTNPVSLSNRQQATSNFVEQALRGPKTSLNSWGRAVCMDLKSQLVAIQPVLAGYVKSSKSSDDIPLDPALGGWLSSVHDKVRELLAATQRQNERPSEYLLEIRHIMSELVDLRDTMTDFLPILRADFDDFYTKHLAFVTEKPRPVPSAAFSSSRTETRPGAGVGVARHKQESAGTPSAPINIPRPSRFYSGMPPPPPAKPMATNSPEEIFGDVRFWLFRKDLYKLKDALDGARDQLLATSRETHRKAMTLDVWYRCGTIADDCEKLTRAIGVAISNTPSDWFESLSSGRLTWPEFSAMYREELPVTLYIKQVENISPHAAAPRALRQRGSTPAGTWCPVSGAGLDMLAELVQDLKVKFKVYD